MYPYIVAGLILYLALVYFFKKVIKKKVSNNVTIQMIYWDVEYSHVQLHTAQWYLRLQVFAVQQIERSAQECLQQKYTTKETVRRKCDLLRIQLFNVCLLYSAKL